MAYLIDTNVFLRLVSKSDPNRQIVLDSLQKLRAKKEVLCYTTQVLAEFWTVCTRPTTARGGYGLSPEATERKAQLIERNCQLLFENQAAHQEWRRLLVAHSVKGVQTYDARLVAVMKAYGITHLLTINGNDFRRYSEITAESPEQIVKA